MAQDIAQSGDMSYGTVAKKLEYAFKLTLHLDALYIGYEADGLLIKTDIQSKNKAYILDKSKGFDSRTREWYQVAKKTMESRLSRPFNDITTGELITTDFSLLVVDGKLVGVIGANIFLKDLQHDFVSLKTISLALMIEAIIISCILMKKCYFRKIHKAMKYRFSIHSYTQNA